MKIAIHTWGSEGDVRPSLNLSERLAGSGHEVRIAFCAADGRDYGARLEGARFQHHAIGAGRPRSELLAVATQVFAETNPLRQLELINDALLAPVLDEFITAAKEDAAWADVLVMHPLTIALAVAAEAARKKLVVVYPSAMLATRAFPPPGTPRLGPFNKVAWFLFQRVLGAKLAPLLDRARAAFGLSGKKRLYDQLDASAMDLVALSPTLLPRPDDWAPKVKLIGNLTPLAPPSTEPLGNPALEAFLAAGPPPVYVTFGSMTDAEKDPREVHAIVERAVELAGCRAIVQGNHEWAQTRGGEKVFRIGPASHDRIFPRCAAIVHHAGAGTTQMALRSGRPSVVVAHMVDQGWWGQRLRALGVAPPHLTRRTLTAEPLAAAIEVAQSSAAMRKTAEALGARMSTEDGLSRAVESIEALRAT